jgi:hypothetical protein
MTLIREKPTTEAQIRGEHPRSKVRAHERWKPLPIWNAFSKAFRIFFEGSGDSKIR